jgi:hypothetical protein
MALLITVAERPKNEGFPETEKAPAKSRFTETLSFTQIQRNRVWADYLSDTGD